MSLRVILLAREKFIMNKIEIKGNVVRILAKTAEVLILIVETHGRYPVSFKVKRFRNEIPAEVFVGICNDIVVGDIVRAEGPLFSERMTKGPNNEVVVTADNNAVYAPFVSATLVEKIASTLCDEKKQAPAEQHGEAAGQANTPAKSAAPAAPAAQQQAQQQPKPAAQQAQQHPDTSGLPGSLFPTLPA